MSKKIGIIAPYQNGDLLTCTSVLRYREELWPNSDIVWFTDDAHKGLLSHLNLEIRPFPHGWDISLQDRETVYLERISKDKNEGKLPWENWKEAMTEGGRLNQELKYKFPLLADLDEAYFPAPWMFSPVQRHGLTYPEISRRVFGCEGRKWHPMIAYSLDEIKRVGEFLKKDGRGRRVMIETMAGSGQSSLDEDMVEEIMRTCREYWPECVFIFGSNKFLRGNEEFPKWLEDVQGVTYAKDNTIRECGLIASYCSLMISVSSSITCAASAWGLTSPPILQFTGSEVCGTRLLANGPFEMVTADGKPLEQAKEEFYIKLKQILSKYE